MSLSRLTSAWACQYIQQWLVVLVPHESTSIKCYERSIWHISILKLVSVLTDLINLLIAGVTKGSSYRECVVQWWCETKDWALVSLLGQKTELSGITTILWRSISTPGGTWIYIYESSIKHWWFIARHVQLFKYEIWKMAITREFSVFVRINLSFSKRIARKQNGVS